MSWIGETDGSTWDYYMVDALGSVRQLTDVDGAVRAPRCLGESFTSYGAPTIFGLFQHKMPMGIVVGRKVTKTK